MNDDRAQLAKLGQTMAQQPALKAVFCIHCGRVYVIDDKHGRETCDCGKELHPVAKTVTLGQMLECGDGHSVRVQNPSDKCDVCGTSDQGDQTGWGMRARHLLCPKCLARSPG